VPALFYNTTATWYYGGVELFPARIACRVAGISARSLDHWISSGLVSPHSVYRGPKQKRDFFLFAFEELVELRIISALRHTGVSLQRIRAALIVLKRDAGKDWQALWLVSDGTNVLVVRQPDVVETLTGPRKGQLAFALVALGSASNEVRGSLLKLQSTKFDEARYKGQLLRYAATLA